MPVISGTQYAQPSDLLNLGLIGSALSSVSGTVQNAALLAASGLADSKLQARYVLPLTQWGQDLVRAVCIIAAYDLLTSRGFGIQQGVDDNIRKRYLDALAWLQDIADEKTSLAYAIDSSTNHAGATTPAPADGSTVVSTSGAFQGQVDPPRGWTDRGATSPPIEDGTGPL